MTPADAQQTVDDVADIRTGDKGDTLIVAVVARSADGYAILVERLTAERVAAHYGQLVRGPVRRTEVATVSALVFELPGLLDGGVTGAPWLDGHGKSFGHHLLSLQL